VLGGCAHRTPNTQHRCRGRQRGFTLIEIIVLIIIIAVLSGVAVPAYSRFYARSKFQRSVQEVVGLLAWARDAAIQAGADSIVRFDAQTETFMVTVESPSVGEDAPLAFQETPEALVPPQPRLLRLGEDVSARDLQVYNPSASAGGLPAGQPSVTEFRFYEDGRSDGAVFTLLSQDGFRAEFEIAPLTGRVVVHDEGE